MRIRIVANSIELKEISFDAPAKALSDIALFLNKTANIVECTNVRHHRIYIQDIIPNWDKHYPNIGIVTDKPAKIEELFD